MPGTGVVGRRDASKRRLAVLAAIAVVAVLAACGDDDDDADADPGPADATTEPALTWEDPTGDAPDPVADIVRTMVEATSESEYRITIELAAPPKESHFYRIGTHFTGEDRECKLFHILPLDGGTSRVNGFCGLPRELVSQHEGGAVVVDGNRVSATFPRTDLPPYVESHRTLDRLFSYTCVAVGDCERFLDESINEASFTI